MKASTIVITGANSGLGLECARAIARSSDWHVALAVRDADRGAQAAAGLRASVPGAAVTALPVDLASLASVRAFPSRLEAAGLPPLRALVCNAGLQEVGSPTRTGDGFETTFAVNHLAHFLLANLLLSRFESTGRIVFVSSGTHDPRMKTGMPPPRYRAASALALDGEPGAQAGRRRYTTSKLCNVLCTYELARRLSTAASPALRDIEVDAFDPGMMPGTGLARGYGALGRFAWRFVLPALIPFRRNVNSVRRSAERLATLATGTSVGTGRYLSEGRVARSSDESYDEQKASDLWQVSVALARLTPAESPLVDPEVRSPRAPGASR